MSLYFILYISTSFILMTVGFLFFIRNKSNYYSKFFLLSILSSGIWILIYLLSLSTTYDKSILIFYSRLIYGLDILIIYFMIFFIVYYKNKKKKYFYIILCFLVSLFSLSVFSPYIVKDMFYDYNSKLYFESYGNLAFIFFILFIVGVLLLVVVTFNKLRKLTFLDKTKVKYITIGFITTYFLEIIFGSILPSFGIRLFIKEQILFFIPFIFSIFYSTYKYNFLDIKLLLSKIINYIFAIFVSVLIISLLREYFLNILDKRLFSFWGINEKFGAFDLTLGILMFSITHFLTKKYIIGESEYYYLSKNITKLKRKIAFINNLSSLNILLNKEFSKLFKTNYASIEVYREKTGDLRGLKEYFLKDKSYKLFINDIVFIEENKNKFDYKKIHEEITDKSYLIFGLINNNREFVGIFKMGPKLFQDGYTQEEVDLLGDFVDFLIGHLKYIEIYSQIHDLNVNLDKKIDEKTIEFNNLLNRQNDFISLASHEIKSPLGSCIFQFDCLIDDLKEKNIDTDILESIEKLNKKLAKVGELTKTIFSVQKFDLGKMKLFKQKVDLNFLLEDKIEFHQKSNVNITFIKQIKNNIGEINVDRIQFEQVLDNLINNAIKFCNKNEPKILIKAFKEKENVIIEVEDNGEGLSQEELEKIFDKYSTGESNSIGLGMGLYLCKKIVELHVGNISAGKGKNLLGACFKIKIPKMID